LKWRCSKHDEEDGANFAPVFSTSLLLVSITVSAQGQPESSNAANFIGSDHLLDELMDKPLDVGATSTLVAADIERGESHALLAVEGTIEKALIEYGVHVKGETGIPMTREKPQAADRVHLK
jgi:hypothetical protein